MSTIYPYSSLPRHNALAQQRQRLANQGQHFGLNWVKPIQWIMNPINNNRLVELCATDVLGFVVPRSLIDGYQRGLDAGREMFLREIMGTLTNVYLCGWLAWGMASILEHSKGLNPKGMGLNAWVDMPLLAHFAKETSKAMSVSKTPQELKKAFLNNILSQLKSTDGIPDIKQYQEYFKSGGYLDPQIQEEIVQKLTSGKQLGVVKNLDSEVHEFLKQTGLNENTRNKIKDLTTQHFMSERKLEGYYQLTRRQRARLAEEIIENQSKTMSEQTRHYREMLSRLTKQSEQPFIDHLTSLAIDKGGLSNEVILVKRLGRNKEKQLFKDLGVGQRSVEDVFRKLKYYLREFLNPALTINGQELAGPITPTLRKEIANRLYHTAGENWLHQKFVPYFQDGLLPYVIKLKRSFVLIPLGLTLLVGCTFSYINNWITQQKYHGRVFFPGEGLPDDVAHLRKGLF